VRIYPHSANEFAPTIVELISHTFVTFYDILSGGEGTNSERYKNDR